MAIKFVCSCGKHLKARDEMAARRSMCPRCGAPVGVPSLQPTHPGTPAGPLSPVERLRARRGVRPLAVDPWAAPPAPTAAEPSRIPELEAVRVLHSGVQDDFHRPVDTGLVRQLLATRRRDTRAVGWMDDFGYLVHAVPMLLAVTILLTGTVGTTVLVLPAIFVLPLRSFLLAALGMLLVVGFVLFGYAYGYLEQTLVWAASGDRRYKRWMPRSDAALRYVAICSIALFGGPALLFATSFLYWLNCGDPGTVDWLILFELNALATLSVLLSLSAAAVHGRIRSSSPVCVADLVRRLGARVLMGAGLAVLLLMADELLALSSLERIARHEGSGLLLLAAAVLAALLVTTAFFRLIGRWQFNTRRDAPSPS